MDAAIHGDPRRTRDALPMLAERWLENAFDTTTEAQRCAVAALNYEA